MVGGDKIYTNKSMTICGNSYLIATSQTVYNLRLILTYNTDFVNIQLHHHVVRKNWLLFSQMAWQPELEILCFLVDTIFFSATSQIACNLGLISNLQYRLSGRPTESPYCEEEPAFSLL